MQKWVRNILVVLVSVVTFGLVTPTFAYNEQEIKSKGDKQDVIQLINSIQVDSIEDSSVVCKEAISLTESYVEQFVHEGQTQVIKKFGPRISDVLALEFEEVILPQMEIAIRNIAQQYNDDQLSNLAITENPGKGLSEKIFHIKNVNSNEDIIRFHVRRDHPPQQGYWFNFHYHTYHDDFITHYDLGNLYWAKDTPPQWMS